MSRYVYQFDTDYIIRHRKQSRLLEMRSFHHHQAYEIIYILKGRKTYMTTEGFYELTPGTVCLTSPNELHKTSDKEVCEKIILYFTKQYLSQNFTKQAQEHLLQCFNKKTLKINDDEINNFSNLCAEAIENRNNHSEFFVYIGKILKYLSEASAIIPENSEKQELRITSILKYIENNSRRSLSIEYIASEFNITKFHLCRLFREELDTTVIQYLNAIRTQNMCNLLANKNLSIAECSRKCGFNSSEYAARVFSGIMHISPTEYRKIKQGDL